MASALRRNAFLLFLALVFTVGLSFVTVELPYLADQAIMDHVHTPGFDSQADASARLKTQLFISHYHLRAVGYACFGAMVLLIVAGFATRRKRLAMLGGLAFMLPVFAQFAGVMFFLSGLGILNVLWLPVLDISFGVAALGTVIRAPYDLLRWLFGLAGMSGYWIIVYAFIGSGLLLFFLGTFAWLSARARKRGVADFWVYRISRHPQYLGWIVWSYGLYLLILQGRYPKRSWGIDASLPWLVSTLVIIGVAMMEEMSMRRRYGEEYEEYRATAPFLFPVPGWVERLLALPFHLFFGAERPRSRGHVAAVLSFYALLLVGASFFFYGNGMERTTSLFRSDAARQALAERLANQIREEPNWRRHAPLAHRLAMQGEAAVEPLLGLLRDPDPEMREVAAVTLRDFPSERAFPGLVEALDDPSEDVRWHAYEALERLGSREAVGPLLPLLDDPASHIRSGVLRALATLGAEQEVVDAAGTFLTSSNAWERHGAVTALGVLRSEAGIDLLAGCLDDESRSVREEAVLSLLRIGSPGARPALERALTDEDAQVRLYATEALKRLPREG